MKETKLFVYLLPFASIALNLSLMSEFKRRKKKKLIKDLNEFRANMGGNTSWTDKIEPGGKKGKRHKTVRVMARGGNPFYNPNTALCKSIGDQLLRDSLMGPVVRLEARIGEVANLPDPWDQWRSCAAILAKKYQDTSQRLRNIYNAMQRRILSEEECADVFRIVEGLGVKDGNSEGTGSPWKRPFTEDVAGAGGGEWEPVGVGGGCAHEDEDEPGEPDGEGPEADPSGLAEREEEDECL